MALGVALRELDAHLLAFQEALVDLRITITEDKPLKDDTVLVDLFGDATEDLLGWLQGARRATHAAYSAAAQRVDLPQVWRALLDCQEQVNQINSHLATDLLQWERIASLQRFGRRRGGEWQPWSKSMKMALLNCQPLFFAVQTALLACWQEVGERTWGDILVIQTNGSGRCSGQSIVPPSRPAIT